MFLKFVIRAGTELTSVKVMFDTLLENREQTISPNNPRSTIPFNFCLIYFHALIDYFLAFLYTVFYHKVQLHRLTPHSQGKEPTLKQQIMKM